MAEKRKISVRKVLQVLLTLVVTTGCIIAMVSASRIEDNQRLTSVALHISNEKRYHFVEEKEIMDLAINNRHIDVMHTPISRLDLHSMEQVIHADKWVSDAQVYIDNDRVLQMYVTQRIPAARIFQQNGLSYYMDTTLSTMPLSDHNIYYTMAVTNVPEIKDDSISRSLKKQILTMVRYIQSDSFWNAQVSQVIVDSDATFELMPVLGNQKIFFGDTSRMKDKFASLFVFYKNVLNRIGWDKYETLDVRFKDQVIALPSLPYNGPVDKAVANMNWINSIVETEAVSDAKDSLKAEELKEKRAVAERKRVLASRMNAKHHGKAVTAADLKKNKNKPGKAQHNDIKKTPLKPVDKNKQKNTQDKNKKGSPGNAGQSKKVP